MVHGIFFPKTMWWWQTKKAELLKEWKVSLGLPVQENWLAEVEVTECERSTGENSGNPFKSVFSFKEGLYQNVTVQSSSKKDKSQVLTTVDSVLAVTQIGKMLQILSWNKKKNLHYHISKYYCMHNQILCCVAWLISYPWRYKAI